MKTPRDELTLWRVILAALAGAALLLFLMARCSAARAMHEHAYYTDPAGWAVTAVKPGYWVGDLYALSPDEITARAPAFAYIARTGARGWVGLGLTIRPGVTTRWDNHATVVEVTMACAGDTLVATSVEWIFFTEPPSVLGVLAGGVQQGWVGGREHRALLPGVKQLVGPIVVPNPNAQLARTAAGEIMVFARFEFGNRAEAQKRLLSCRVFNVLTEGSQP